MRRLRRRWSRQPDITLDELRAWILQELAVSISISTVWNTLRRLKLTLKKSPSWRLNRPAPTSLRLERVGTR